MSVNLKDEIQSLAVSSHWAYFDEEPALWVKLEKVLELLDAKTQQIREASFVTFAKYETVDVDGEERPIKTGEYVSLEKVLAVLVGTEESPKKVKL